MRDQTKTLCRSKCCEKLKHRWWCSLRGFSVNHMVWVWLLSFKSFENFFSSFYLQKTHTYVSHASALSLALGVCVLQKKLNIELWFCLFRYWSCSWGLVLSSFRIEVMVTYISSWVFSLLSSNSMWLLNMWSVMYLIPLWFSPWVFHTPSPLYSWVTVSPSGSCDHNIQKSNRTEHWILLALHFLGD